MKVYVLLAGVALLAACTGKKEEAAPAATESAPAAAAAAPTTAPGTYDVTAPDGTKMTSTLNADGSYEDKDAAGKSTAKGKWADKDGKTCFTPDGGKEECFTGNGAPAADGSFEVTGSDGKVTKVKLQAK